MPIINLANHLNPNHKDIFQSADRRLLVYGSKGSGKSYSVADKLLIAPSIQRQITGKNTNLKTVVIRQSMPALKRSCIELFEERADLFKMRYHLNRGDFVATYDGGSRIQFIGLDDSKAWNKLQSITNVDFVWIEELPEVQERVYENADLILRGGHGLYKQFIGTFNPVSTGSWIYRRWWEEKNEKITALHKRTEDNPFIDKDYLQTLKDLEKSNKSLYTIYYLGQWGVLKGVIYDNYDIVNEAPKKYNEVIYGLDFGWNVPTALLRGYVKGEEATIQQLLYKTRVGDEELIRTLKANKIKSEPIYCDCAEPDRIETLYKAGFNVHPADKSVGDGLLFCKSMKLHYLKDSVDVIKEAAGYCWKEDKNGKPLDEPCKFDDHAMDAKRYMLYTHLKKQDIVRVRMV